MLQTRHSVIASSLLCTLILSAALVTVRGQTAAPADTKLVLRAALVLTPEFCATKMKDKAGETFETGKAACVELEPALKDAFSSLTAVSSAASSGDAQVLLLPRFVAVDRTSAVTSFSKREMVLLLEWTVKDLSGRTVWLETVQGSASGHGGTIGTVKRNRTQTVGKLVKDAAEHSASKMAASPELRKLTQ